MDSAALVIKVSYGDTLRRFSVPINKDGLLDLDMVGLKVKIISLFNFPADAELTLTYVDEDGDLVTIVDDYDLRDVMKQRLKFLRINVQLKGEKKFTNKSASASGSSTPLRSPQPQTPIRDINASISEILRGVPEPLRETLSKLSGDLSKLSGDLAVRAVSGPVLGEFLEGLSKLAQTSRPQQSPVLGEFLEGLSKLGQTSRSQETGLSAAMEPNTSQDGGLPSKSSSVGPILKSMEVSSAHASPLELNMEPPCHSSLSGTPFTGFGPGPSSCHVGATKEDAKQAHNKRKSVNVDASTSSAGLKTTSYAPNAPNVDAKSFNECPFGGIPVTNDFISMPGYVLPHINPSRKCHSRDYWNLVGMFHKGIRCDGCGVLPITGPRFKSKVKDDFDLCSICFSEMGNETDYIRMDRPVSMRHGRPFKGQGHPNPWINQSAPPFAHGALSFRLGRPKLDSRFILDVNVPDGTVMAPSTPFTKIWRMRNDGSVGWPRGTQLVWIGGDRFSESPTVEIEIPADGVPTNGELDVAIDFTAPELPGRYTSYWRMASPSGVKFGQRVWVLIHVDTSLKDSVSDGFHELNLNGSRDNNSSKVSGGIDGSRQSAMGGHSGSSNGFSETVKPVTNEHVKNVGSSTPINDSLLVGDVTVALPPTAPQDPSTSSVSYPFIDLAETTLAEAPCEPSSVKDVPVSSEVANENNEIEQVLLKELEEMGFKQIDLNKEVLRKNEYNLEQSVDALCEVEDWDPILEELQEMGFRDEEMNKRLLKKNNGSIKRVVMDLLTGEKA